MKSVHSSNTVLKGKCGQSECQGCLECPVDTIHPHLDNEDHACATGLWQMHGQEEVEENNIDLSKEHTHTKKQTTNNQRKHTNNAGAR